MGPGLFCGTFYILQEPLHVPSIHVRMNLDQSRLVDNILSTERIQHLKYELGAISHGLIYHKDHYKIVQGARICQYQPLVNHSNTS